MDLISITLGERSLTQKNTNCIISLKWNYLGWGGGVPEASGALAMFSFFIWVAVIWVFISLSAHLFCFVLCLFLCECTLKKRYKKPQQNNSILTTKPWCYGPVLTALSVAQQTILMGQTTQSSLRLSGGCDLQEPMECVFFGQSSVNNIPSVKAGEPSWSHVLWRKPGAQLLSLADQRLYTYFRNWMVPQESWHPLKMARESQPTSHRNPYDLLPLLGKDGLSGRTYTGHCWSWSYQLPRGQRNISRCLPHPEFKHCSRSSWR